MNRALPITVLALMSVILGGCGESSSEPQITASVVRAERRSFDGAPPVIPHKPLGATCVTCHTPNGKQVPNHGFAPANPHFNTANIDKVQNCRQCHLFNSAKENFRDSNFVGIRQDLRKGDRLYKSAPPVIPHPLQLRENCQACHSGPSARPEIRCTHPERTNCVQCHMAQRVDSLFPQSH